MIYTSIFHLLSLEYLITAFISLSKCLNLGMVPPQSTHTSFLPSLVSFTVSFNLQAVLTGKAQSFSMQHYWYWGPDDSQGRGPSLCTAGSAPDPYPLDRCLERSPSITTTENASKRYQMCPAGKMTPSWGPLVQLKSQENSRDCSLLSNLLFLYNPWLTISANNWVIPLKSLIIWDSSMLNLPDSSCFGRKVKF